VGAAPSWGPTAEHGSANGEQRIPAGLAEPAPGALNVPGRAPVKGE